MAAVITMTRVHSVLLSSGKPSSSDALPECHITFRRCFFQPSSHSILMIHLGTGHPLADHLHLASITSVFFLHGPSCHLKTTCPLLTHHIIYTLRKSALPESWHSGSRCFNLLYLPNDWKDTHLLGCGHQDLRLL